MEDEKSQIKHTDFNKAFEELYFHQLTIPGINIRNNFEVREIGELVLTSGKLFAWEPYSYTHSKYLQEYELRKKVLDVNLSPGRYSVIASLLNLEPFSDKPKNQDIACVMLRLNNQRPIIWEIAKCVDKSVFSYSIYRKNSFMDIDAAKYICPQSIHDYFSLNWRDKKILELYKIEICDIESLNEIEGCNDSHIISTGESIEGNEDSSVNQWVNYQINPKTPANVISFNSRNANGCASYIGYDIKGNIVSIVTDFFVMSDFEIFAEDLLKKEELF